MNLDKLDKVFSEYIRRRDADENGMVKCCTCDTVAHWKQMDAGHFMSRSNMNTRWNEFNVNGQCPVCNRLCMGEMVEYLVFMKNKYGYEIAGKVVKESQITKNWMQFEIDEMVDEYKQKIKELNG